MLFGDLCTIFYKMYLQYSYNVISNLFWNLACGKTLKQAQGDNFSFWGVNRDINPVIFETYL